MINNHYRNLKKKIKYYIKVHKTIPMFYLGTSSVIGVVDPDETDPRFVKYHTELYMKHHKIPNHYLEEVLKDNPQWLEYFI